MRGLRVWPEKIDMRDAPTISASRARPSSDRDGIRTNFRWCESRHRVYRHPAIRGMATEVTENALYGSVYLPFDKLRAGDVAEAADDQGVRADRYRKDADGT